MSTKKLTKKQYDALKPFEQHLTRGYYGHYTYALRRTEFEKLSEIYRSLGYEKKLDYSCGTCLVQLASTLGELYFAKKKELESETN